MLDRRRFILANQHDVHTLLLMHGNDLTDASMYQCSITNTGSTIGISSSGKYDKALSWGSTTNGYLDVVLPKTLGTTFTVECWIYLSDLTNSYKTICDFNGHSRLFWEIWETNRGPCFFVGNGSWQQTNIMWGNPASVALNQAAFSINNWYHVALVGNGSNVKSYVNGNLTTTSAFYPVFVNQNLRIGNIAMDLSRYYRGLISEFRVSDIQRYTSNFTPPTAPFQS